MNRIKIGLFLLLASASACWKLDPINPSDNSILKTIWKVSFDKGELAGSQSPLITQYGALFTVTTSFNPEELLMLDAGTGEKKWAFQKDNTSFRYMSRQHPFVFDHQFSNLDGKGVLSIDLRNGNEICQHTAYGSVWGSRLGDAVFSIENVPGVDSLQSIVMTDKNCNAKPLITEKITATQFWGITSILPFIDESGDTLVYYCTDAYFWGVDTGETHLICKNISKGIEVHNQWFSKSATNYPPIIQGDNIILVFENLVVALNRKTFEKIWETDVVGGPGSQINLYEGKLVVQDDGYGFLYALNPDNGQVLWKAKTSSSMSMPVYCKGHVYFTTQSDGLLYAVRMSDGAVIWKEKSPDLSQDSGSTFAFGAGVDTLNNRVYVSSFLNMYCFKGVE